MTERQELHIRDARDGEREAIRDLTLRAYAEYAERMLPPAWEALHQVLVEALSADTPVERIVAESRGRLLGSVMLYAPATSAYGAALAEAEWPELRLLAVEPAMRGQGIGEALVWECIARARQKGAAALGLHSSESMQAAMRLYGRLGFERVPEQDFRVEGSELVMGFRRLLR